MNVATVDDLSTRSNSVSSGSWRTAQGVVWGSLSVAILSGWFVVTCLGLRQDLRVWDVIALRFGEGAVLLTPALFVGSLRLRFQAWSQGIVLAVLWGAPFILLIAIFAFNRAIVLLGPAGRGRHHCACAGHGHSFGDTGSRRMAIMAVGGRYLRYRAGDHFGRCVRQSR